MNFLSKLGSLFGATSLSLTPVIMMNNHIKVNRTLARSGQSDNQTSFCVLQYTRFVANNKLNTEMWYGKSNIKIRGYLNIKLKTQKSEKNTMMFQLKLINVPFCLFFIDTIVEARLGWKFFKFLTISFGVKTQGHVTLFKIVLCFHFT